jgi:hypothetical protein
VTLNNQNSSNVNKPYQITFEERPDYLYVYITGDHDSYEISRSFWLEVAEMSRKTDYKKVLIEEDIPEAVSISDMYRLASELPQMGFYGVRVAFMDRYAEQNELNEFGELVAVNRGMMAKIFNDIQAAEEWLLLD